MATADNYIIRNNGRVVLLFVKTGANNADITIVSTKTVGGLAVADQVVTVPATTGVVAVGALNPDIYNDPSGDIDVSTDEETAITMYVLES